MNLLVCVAMFRVASAATSTARRAWVDLTIAGQVAAATPGSPAPGSISVGLVYLVLFIALGLGLTALLRTARPLTWAWTFGLGYAAHWLHTSDVFLLYSGTKLYARLAVECVAPVAGCVLGALGSRRLRRTAPGGPSNAPALRGRA